MDYIFHRGTSKWKLVLLIGILSSCSVKENRWICPCHLILKAQNPADLSREGSIVLTVFEGGEKELSQAFSWRSIRDEDYTATVSKGEKNMSIIMNKERSFIVGTELRIKEGEEADSLWASSVRASCTEDVCTIPVEPRKQHACVHLVMTGYKASDYPFDLRVCGNTCGLDLLSLKPIEGSFWFDASISHKRAEEFKPEVRRQMAKSGFDSIWDSAEVKYTFMLPRQTYDDGAGLYLNLYDKSTATSNYKPINISLGNIISKAGYDWSDADLKDIFISLDFISSEGQVRVMDWESGWTDSLTI
ncbi:MAG: hypothetical protein MJY83_03055 [Bacteroidales bacterium]|nr:hypothetical protein [Bacteroidales bacterium]